MGDDNSKRMRYSKEPKLDKSLLLWIEKTRRSKVNINGLYSKFRICFLCKYTMYPLIYNIM